MAERFLLSRLSSLGDVVCCLPVASALKDTYPECEVTWVVDPRFAGIVECCTAVDEVVKASPSLSPSSWPALKGEFDVAFDLQGLLKSAIPVARAKAARKLGYHWQREGSWLFSSRVLPDPTSFHIVDQYVDVARAAGAEVSEARFELTPKAEDLGSMRAKLDALSVENRFVVMNPGAGWATKRWPAGYFAEVADNLTDRGFQSVLIGGRADADHAAADEVLSHSKHPPVKLTGETSVRELVALLSIARAHLGGDTGSTHISAALRIPAIGLYSITRPQRSCPYGQIERCHYNPTSLSNILPDEVFDTVLEAIS